ncbi:hypothetical protein [Micromonospora avicenniae]|uniref:Uncharacterized protein n=1 Tax=Micromonospora avicenniae TaxID=1198245 RepID=A0A1N6SD32_9ACTN|nr:hypothetical protein [Micromonospora avicenniae]SIQ38981.1 hypothetical protein SAMN05444858_102209 [Micromonospora avicenniae]
MTFEEYADLARQLAERRRAGERGVAAAERRRDLHTAADFLDRRLAGQGTRLDQLGRAIGEPVTVSAPTEVDSASERWSAAEVDPAVELELARRYADEADRHGQQAELLARRPALLPAWSPVARAAAVYLASAGAGAVLGFVMVVAADVGALGAGLPAVALISGWLALGRWGRAPLAQGASARYPALGVAVCFLLVPLVFCGYLFMLRFLR